MQTGKIKCKIDMTRQKTYISSQFCIFIRVNHAENEVIKFEKPQFEYYEIFHKSTQS
jgi:hypothetical protein